jgi:hypothetical protein
VPEKDYSGTPLPKKLGINEGSRIAIVDAPEGFAATLRPMPNGVDIASRVSGRLDVVVVFATRLASLERRFGAAVRSLEFDGGLWVCWPKKVSKVETDLTFEIVQGMGLEAGLVDNKIASVTQVYQGMRFVYRLKDRPDPNAEDRAPSRRTRSRSQLQIRRRAASTSGQCPSMTSRWVSPGTTTSSEPAILSAYHRPCAGGVSSSISP